MANNFRRGKIEKLIDRYEYRRKLFLSQLEHATNETLKCTLSGHIIEIESVVADLRNEFDLKDYDAKIPEHDMPM